MNLRLMRAKKEDIPTIQKLEESAFGFTWDTATFQKELGRPNGITTVLWLDQERVGSALLVWAADEAQLNSIVLDAKQRGKGLSRYFLGGLLAYCRQNQMAWITLEVKWDNLPAQKLYRRFGFVTTACRERYYRDGQDARIMWAGHLQAPSHQERLSSYDELASALVTRRSA